MNSHLGKALSGVKVVSLALNAPGPVAAARLAALGAEVTKVEPPAGDPLKTAAPEWYESLCRKQTVAILNLKDETGRRRLEELLAGADLLLASFRPSALRRLQLDWESLHARHPRLCFAGIIGYPPPLEERSGHDLTYLASAGLLAPPQLPLSLFVDLAGAERCVSKALALLFSFSRTKQAGCEFVSLYECACELAAPRNAGLTRQGGTLGGGYALYSMYRASDGWIAVAALEPHFARRLLSELGLSATDRTSLEETFRRRSAADWEQWAIERDLPLAAVR
ncbi:MAG TPA: CoA transferase [Candidatus Angelobacter sp.]|nr:CoA transferase [Candidatus Angelobacter sp.]